MISWRRSDSATERCRFDEINAGRAVTHMQLTAWKHTIGSCMFTVDQASVQRFLEVPDEYDLTAFLSFGYPDREIHGRKDRDRLRISRFVDRSVGNSIARNVQPFGSARGNHGHRRVQPFDISQRWLTHGGHSAQLVLSVTCSKIRNDTYPSTDDMQLHGRRNYGG